MIFLSHLVRNQKHKFDVMKGNYMKSVLLNCRICGGSRFQQILNLGNQSMTGVFPKISDEDPPSGELILIRCTECNLVQLDRNFDPTILYGESYGYRSSLNPTMTRHLQSKAEQLAREYGFENCLVVDVGSNDATSLKIYDGLGFRTVGVDPLLNQFAECYPKNSIKLSNFFNQDIANSYASKVDILTSIAMFYDLEDPNEFVNLVGKSLSRDGIWHFEQSYLPFMLNSNSFDTICHEHLEYYSLSVINSLLKKHQLRVISVEFNSINGGSIAVTAAKDQSSHKTSKLVKWAIDNETKLALDTNEPYEKFASNVQNLKKSLKDLVFAIQSDGKKIGALGASTKGNVLLQYCGITSDDLISIGEVNPDKYGRVTPGSRIKIVSEDELLNQNPDYILILPWHFKEYIVNKIRQSASKNCKVILPLPNIEILS
jgi:hypothetical protein